MERLKESDILVAVKNIEIQPLEITAIEKTQRRIKDFDSTFEDVQYTIDALVNIAWENNSNRFATEVAPNTFPVPPTIRNPRSSVDISRALPAASFSVGSTPAAPAPMLYAPLTPARTLPAVADFFRNKKPDEFQSF